MPRLKAPPHEVDPHVVRLRSVLGPMPDRKPHEQGWSRAGCDDVVVFVWADDLMQTNAARVVGVDAARCIALVGMMATHILPEDRGPSTGWRPVGHLLSSPSSPGCPSRS